jgi:hypothetical protein
MSSQFPIDGREASNVHEFPNNHASDIRADLTALRKSVSLAWQERGVMLTPEERKELRDEIQDLRRYLSDLTSSGS